MPLPKTQAFDFEAWSRVYRQAGAPNEIAEMIASGDDAILRVRDRTGKLTEQVLSGKDPLRVAVGEADFRIVHVSVGRAIAYGSDVRFFVSTTGPLRLEPAEGLLQMLQASLPNFGASVNIQNSPWFINDVDYPFLNPFVETARPPTREEYLRTNTMSCMYVDGLPSCKIQ